MDTTIGSGLHFLSPLRFSYDVDRKKGAFAARERGTPSGVATNAGARSGRGGDPALYASAPLLATDRAKALYRALSPGAIGSRWRSRRVDRHLGLATTICCWSTRAAAGLRDYSASASAAEDPLAAPQAVESVGDHRVAAAAAVDPVAPAVARRDAVAPRAAADPVAPAAAGDAVAA